MRLLGSTVFLHKFLTTARSRSRSPNIYFELFEINQDMPGFFIRLFFLFLSSPSKERDLFYTITSYAAPPPTGGRAQTSPPTPPQLVSRGFEAECAWF